MCSVSLTLSYIKKREQRESAKICSFAILPFKRAIQAGGVELELKRGIIQHRCCLRHQSNGKYFISNTSIAHKQPLLFILKSLKGHLPVPDVGNPCFNHHAGTVLKPICLICQCSKIHDCLCLM